MSPGSWREASSTNLASASSKTLPSANFPTRIFGPCRSAMMATSTPARWAASRTMAARSMWSCAVPWLKFRRTTVTPARIIFSSIAGSLEAGPRVATILVALLSMSVSCNGARFSHGTGYILGTHSPHEPGAWRGWCSRAGNMIKFVPGPLNTSASSYCFNSNHPIPSACGAFLQNLKRRQGFAFEHFEESPATGRDVAHVFFDSVFGDGGKRVAAAGNAEGGAGGNCLRNCFRATLEGGKLEHAHRAVPDNGAGGHQLVGQFFRGLRADVQDQVVVCHLGGSFDSGWRVGAEGLGGHHVGRDRHLGAARLHGRHHRASLVQQFAFGQ